MQMQCNTRDKADLVSSDESLISADELQVVSHRNVGDQSVSRSGKNGVVG